MQSLAGERIEEPRRVADEEPAGTRPSGDTVGDRGSAGDRVDRTWSAQRRRSSSAAADAGRRTSGRSLGAVLAAGAARQLDPRGRSRR